MLCSLFGFKENLLQSQMCKPLVNQYSMPVKSGLQSALNRHTVRPFTESDDTRGCNNTIFSPEDKQGTARNMLRIIM